MKRIYLAGPLFCRAETDYNIKVKEQLSEAGFEVILPQDNTMDFDCARMCEEEYSSEVAEKICAHDLGLIDSSDILVINLDGRVPDEGACVELGYAYAKGKPCFGLKTDIRVSEFGIDNMMIASTLKGKIARSIPELAGMLGKV